jgi:hypothetical protein
MNPYGSNGLPDGKVLEHVESLARMCRKMTPDVVQLLHTIIKGEHPDATVGDRLKAAQLVLDRGFGRAVSVVEMHVTETPKDVRQLSREQLVRLANGEVIEIASTIDVTPEPQDGSPK